jgi:hypothetical protein
MTAYLYHMPRSENMISYSSPPKLRSCGAYEEGIWPYINFLALPSLVLKNCHQRVEPKLIKKKASKFSKLDFIVTLTSDKNEHKPYTPNSWKIFLTTLSKYNDRELGYFAC